MKALLISGINGFIGSNFSKAFLADFQIVGLDLDPGQLIPVTYKSWYELHSIDKVDCIIHLAGKAHAKKSTKDAQEYFDINLGLTQKIFEYFLQSSAEKFIFFSSVKAVADSVEDVLQEDVTPYPLTPYGQSKLAAETYILDTLKIWEQTQRELGNACYKKVFILRPSMIHGPGNKGNLNLLFQIVKKNIPWPLAAFSNQRSMLSIDNLTFIIRQLIERNDIQPGIYQVADDEFISTNEIIELMAAARRKNPSFWFIPKSIVKAMARLGDFLHLPLNSERLVKLTESYRVSNQKIKNALQIEQLPVRAKEGLQRTFQSL